MPFLLQRRALAIAFFAISAAAAAQQTITVGPTGAYPTIQQGVNAANAGDSVLVQPGTYQENVTIAGKAITLESSACAVQPVPSGCNTQTIIDGNNQGSVLTIANVFSMSTNIAGFTLINGRSGSSGSSAGVSLQTAGAAIANNAFSANAAAIAVNNGALQASGNQITDVIVTGSQCSSANGIYLTGTNTVVLDSQGAVAVTTILGNTIAASGKCTGGVGIIDQQGTSTFIGLNQISGQSLGISTFPTSAYTYIYDNLITGGTTGAISVIHATNTPAAGVPDTFIVNNTLVNNLSGVKGLSGSAGPAELAISGTFSRVEVVNNIFSTNSATNPDIDCAGSPSSTTNQITPLVLDHNLFYNSGTNGKLGADGCPVSPGSYGNLNASPVFVSSTNFQLAAGSPAIDSGNNSFASIAPASNDIAGNPRVANGTGVPAAVVDMGAYEAVPAGSPVPASYSSLNAFSSSYYLNSGNNLTIYANLSSTANGSTFAPSAGQTVVFTGSGGLAPVTVMTDTSGNASVPFTVATPGLYAFTVTYAGGSHPPVSSIVLYVYVANPLAVPTLGLTSSNNPSLAGQSVTFTVTSNATDGSHPSPVVLADNGTTLATLTTSSGSATYTTSTLTQGAHPLTATFAGDATHTTGAASLTQIIGNYTPTTTTLSSTANPSLVNQSITLTAHVTSASGVPTGSIIFTDGSAQLGAVVTVDGNGNAAYTTAALGLGSHALTATFTATGAYANSSGTLLQVVNADPTTAVLGVTPQVAPYGAPLTLTATLTAPAPATGTPTGSVSFTDSGTVIGTASLSGGVATLQLSTLSGGPHTVGCTYSGIGNYASSVCNPVAITITQASTSVSVTSSANPSSAFTPITFTVTPSTAASSGGAQTLPPGTAVTLTITPSGSAGTSYALTTGATGSVTYTSTGLAAGAYTVSASYPATANYAASTSSLNQVVNANATSTVLTAAPNPGIQNTLETLTAIVSAGAGAAAPSGTVTFLDGSAPLATIALSQANGNSIAATLQTSALLPGQHSISAVYNPGASSFSASSSAVLSLTIAPQDFTLTADTSSITIQTEHHASLQLTLSPIGGFSAPISLSCGTNLPPYLTCELPSSVTLNGNTSVTLKLDTDALLNFASSAPPQERPGTRGTGGLVLAALLPLGFLGCRRRRPSRAARANPYLAAIVLMSFLTTLCGCSGKYPGHTPPGTYAIPVTAAGTLPGSTAPTTHTAVITLNVTP